MRERLDYIDRLKGFAILLVVLGHIIQKHTIDTVYNPLFEAIYSFHMPFFFFLCGYIADKTTRINSAGDYWSFIKKKARSLLIPFFFWPLVVENYFFSLKTDYSMTGIIMKQLGPTPHLWFLFSLFKIMVIFSVFYLLSKKFKKGLLSDCILLLVVLLPLAAMGLLKYSYMLFLIHTSLFFVGVFLSKYQVLKAWFSSTWVFTTVTLLYVFLIGYYHLVAPLTIPLKALKIILVFILSFCASVSLYNFSKKLILPIWMDKFWLTMGQATMVIYVVPVHILPASFAFSSELPLMMIAIIGLFISVVHMYISVGIGKIIECIPFLNLLLFGALKKIAIGFNVEKVEDTKNTSQMYEVSRKLPTV